jgi:hypothetical protein
VLVYTGIGSREAQGDALALMTETAGVSELLIGDIGNSVFENCERHFD